MLKQTFAICLFFLAFQSFGQTNDKANLIAGMWYYDSPDPETRGTLSFHDDGNFEIAWYSKTADAKVSKGTYTVEGDQVIFIFESGTRQVEDIEVLDKEHLQLRYIETVSRYSRNSLEK
ncbi:MAG: lipocalin family protein [Crocinitomicaceae bacterium]